MAAEGGSPELDLGVVETAAAAARVVVAAAWTVVARVAVTKVVGVRDSQTAEPVEVEMTAMAEVERVMQRAVGAGGWEKAMLVVGLALARLAVASGIRCQLDTAGTPDPSKPVALGLLAFRHTVLLLRGLA